VARDRCAPRREQTAWCLGSIDIFRSVVADVEEASPSVKLTTKTYEKELRELHVELVKLQEWVRHKGLKVCIVFEGRDGAGKGGTIKAITERVSPRVFRVMALPAPTEREKSQMYGQRYIRTFPAAGEVVIFDRSWYNRAGVERVMGFCTEEQAKRFLEMVPLVEKAMVDSGIILMKYWLEVSPEEQTRRLEARIDDGRKIWKLSPMDLKSYSRWYDYSRARDAMFAATDTDFGALVRRALGRQEAGAAQHHPSPARPDPLREAAPREGGATQAAETRRLPGARLPVQDGPRGGRYGSGANVSRLPAGFRMAPREPVQVTRQRGARDRLRSNLVLQGRAKTPVAMRARRPARRMERPINPRRRRRTVRHRADSSFHRSYTMRCHR
jgi:polyphosphate kinase